MVSLPLIERAREDGVTNNWKTGSFDVAFSDLFQASHGLEVLELDDIDKIISGEAAKGK